MYQLKSTQFIPASIETCWDYFSSPNNLKEITPKNMGFIIKTDLPGKMYEGMMIEYIVTPLLGIPMNWITEIKAVKEGVFFIDEQRKGPYKIWHHEHHFKAVDGGVEMTDIVSYEVPFGILGKLVHPLIVRPKLEQIFKYRTKRVEEIFPNKK
ncbi:MAG: SRPBCC family protein [Flavobacteriia bacterium]|jgi:ligand-binding SRPBCC domain-containing protein